MPIALTPEQEELRRTVRRWLDAHCPPTVVRRSMAEPAGELPAGELPGIWQALADQGWLGLHVAEADGGQGFGLAELVVVLEELGRSLVPGPVLSTALAAALLARTGDAKQRRRWLPGLVDGSLPGAVHLGGGALVGAEADDGALDIYGVLRPVLGAPSARLLIAPAEPGGWCLLEVGRGEGAVVGYPDTEAVARYAAGDVPGALAGETDGTTVTPLVALDPTRSLGEVRIEVGCRVTADRRLPGLDAQMVRDLALVLGAAEAAGGAAWCVEAAAEHAKVRVQFGRPIGQFQAVKHRLADMLVVREQVTVAAWDGARAFDGAAGSAAGSTADATANATAGATVGATVDTTASTAVDGGAAERSLAAAVAGAIALDGFAECAKGCIQLLGGIGFTWEHDAHLYLKRAVASRALLGDPDGLRQSVTSLALRGARRSISAELPPEAGAFREAIAPLVARAGALEGVARRRYLCDEGLLVPHWPGPWGREASPLEQLVIDEALRQAGIVRPGLGVGAWALPTLIAHGTERQQQRWVRPTLLGELLWCQLFSEPGAGSDLAALSTRAVRVDGGWRLTGQKVWTSMAQVADWGICLARSDPEAPKHDGITYFVVDMKAPGVDIRPLRELTGAAMFNEVFFDEVFVPDDAVVGQPGEGWRIGRTTLANERVSISSGATFGVGVESVLRRYARMLADAAAGAGLSAETILPGAAVRLGTLLAEAQSLRLLAEQATLRSLSGLDPGAGASVRKLLGAEHEQRVQEAGLALYGPEGAVAEGSPARWGNGFLSTRCLTIAGGTSEVQRNVIGERLLGLPRDPEPAG